MFDRYDRTPIVHFLDLAEQMLAADESVIVPVKKLWLRLQAESQMPVPPCDQFTEMLRADQRFQLLLEDEASPQQALPAEWTTEQRAVYDQIMEELGFFRGPRVKLGRVELNHDLLLMMLARPLEILIEVVKGARELKPSDGALEPHLNQIWEKVVELKTTIERELNPALQSRAPSSSDLKF